MYRRSPTPVAGDRQYETRVLSMIPIVSAGGVSISRLEGGEPFCTEI